MQKDLTLDQGSATYGQIQPAKQNHLTCSPFTNCSNCMARLVVLHFMNLPSLQHLVYLSGTTYEKLQCTINVLCVVFCAFVLNCENQELI